MKRERTLRAAVTLKALELAVAKAALAKGDEIMDRLTMPGTMPTLIADLTCAAHGSYTENYIRALCGRAVAELQAIESPAKEQPGEVASMVNQLRMHAGATDTHIPRPMLARAADLLAKLGQEWIPVSERLPHTNGSVLVIGKEVDDGYGEIWIALAAAVRNSPQWRDTNEVTHWMPLPPPPPERP